MSAGNFFGSVWNTVILGGMWTILGFAMDKIFKAFNTTLAVLPTYQDAVNGLGIMQVIWSSIMIVIFFVIWLNYLLNQNSMASGGV